MIRISLIGPGDIDYHYFQLLRFSRKKLEREIEKIAQILAELKLELVLLPDRGICFEVAKLYKKFGGRKVYATMPFSDKDFGIKHLMPYFQAQVEGKKVFDKVIDTENWYKQDLTCCLYGDLVLMLGNSLGSLGELVYGFYLYKLFVGVKPKVKPKKEKIHPEIKAGRKFPFSVIVYQPFFKEKLNFEIEAYIKKVKGKIYYSKNAQRLKTILKRLI
ncbi:hypothetical protein J7K91_01500 [bacterium]|nr:hypothetical protein [bacterium]